MDFLRRTWAEINTDALTHNFEVIKRRCGNSRIMAVVKANAYGHGVNIVLPVLEKAGADAYAVSNLAEAVELRDLNITKPILILGYTPPENAADICRYGITQCVFSVEYAAELSERLEKANKKAKVFIKLDTGMGRIGFDCREDSLPGLEEALAAARLPGFDVKGVFTHFAAADRVKTNDDGFTDEQYRRFIKAKEAFTEAGFDIEYSCCNSAAVMQDADKSGGICRPGIILYGLEPDSALSPMNELIPVMTLKSVVSFVKELKRGQTVSYGRTFTAPTDMRVATICAGYADGYPRVLSNKAYVTVNGKRANIIGRVCMDQLMADVSGIDVKPGDEVTLFGADPTLTGLADIANTINYEIACNINKRVPRIAVSENEKVYFNT